MLLKHPSPLPKRPRRKERNHPMLALSLSSGCHMEDASCMRRKSEQREITGTAKPSRILEGFKDPSAQLDTLQTPLQPHQDLPCKWTNAGL